MSECRYFVSYAHSGPPGSSEGVGFGNTEIPTPEPIGSLDHVNAIAAAIAEAKNYENVVVLNFVLIGKRRL